MPQLSGGHDMRLAAIVTACSLCAVIALPAYGSEANKSESTKQSDNQKIVCKYMYHQGGLISRKPTCATQAHWKDRRLSLQESVRLYQARSLTSRPW
jgi:hypothetical protein